VHDDVGYGSVGRHVNAWNRKSTTCPMTRWLRDTLASHAWDADELDRDIPRVVPDDSQVAWNARRRLWKSQLITCVRRETSRAAGEKKIRSLAERSNWETRRAMVTFDSILAVLTSGIAPPPPPVSRRWIASRTITGCNLLPQCTLSKIT